MNRYFLYLVLLNMISNVVSVVPNHLLKQRFDGSVMALVLALPIGMVLMYTFMKSVERFPNQGLPEILSSVFPKWISSSILFIYAVLWFVSGLLTLFVFGDITKVFINPDFSNYQILGFFLALIIPVSLLKSDRILYMLEILFGINIPLIAFIAIKSLLFHYMKWDSVWTVATAITKMPTWSTLSATTYIFFGYSNMVIFGHLLAKKLKPLTLVLIGLSGAATLFTTFFIPIGLQGADGVGDYLYPWVTSSDSLRIELGFVERVLFPFLLLYASISFMNMIVMWHVSLKLFPDLFSFVKRWKKLKPFTKWLMPTVFAVITLYFGGKLDEPHIFSLGQTFLSIRLGAEILLVLLVFYVSRRKKA